MRPARFTPTRILFVLATVPLVTTTVMADHWSFRFVASHGAVQLFHQSGTGPIGGFAGAPIVARVPQYVYVHAHLHAPGPSAACLGTWVLLHLAQASDSGAAMHRNLQTGHDLACASPFASLERWPNGQRARALSAGWYYPNGERAVTATGSWYYPDGTMAISRQGTWFYPDGTRARRDDGTWFAPDGTRLAKIPRDGVAPEEVLYAAVLTELWQAWGRARL